MLILDQLKKRGIALANRCFLCGEEEETIDHLLIHRSKDRLLWDLFLAIIGVNWVFPMTIKEILLSWHATFVGKKRKNVWMTASLNIFWTIWHKRNNIAFDNKEFSEG